MSDLDYLFSTRTQLIGMPEKNPFLDQSYLSLAGRVGELRPKRDPTFNGLGSFDGRPFVFSKELKAHSHLIPERRRHQLEMLLEEEEAFRRQGVPGYRSRPAAPMITDISQSNLLH